MAEQQSMVLIYSRPNRSTPKCLLLAIGPFDTALVARSVAVEIQKRLGPSAIVETHFLRSPAADIALIATRKLAEIT